MNAIDIKYTTDGRKVVVIGNLNSQEKIVQEIFVTADGAEIPSGENFVVKSLHDAPVKSWKHDELEKLEKRYQEDKTYWNNKLKELNTKQKEQCKKVESHLAYIGKVLQNSNEKCFELISDFLSGKIKYFVTGGYDPTIVSYDDYKLIPEDFGGPYDFRLFSIFGKDDGTFKMGINTYTDGSCGYNQKIYLFKTYEEAFEKFKEIVQGQSVDSKLIEIAKKYDIKLDKEKLVKYYEKTIAGIKKSEVDYIKRIEDQRKELKEIEEEIGLISGTKPADENVWFKFEVVNGNNK